MKNLASLLLSACLFTCVVSFAQDSLKTSPKAITQKEFFLPSDALEITLESDLKRIRSKRDKGIYHPATLP